MLISDILICEDHAISRLGIQCSLEDIHPTRSFTFRKTGSGKEAIELVRRHAPDLLILDLSLPDMKGSEVLRTIREEKLPTKVLIMTSEESAPVLQQLLRHRPDAIVLKSHSLVPFAEAILQLENDPSDWIVMDSYLEKRIRNEDRKNPLSPREFEVMNLLTQGHTNRSAGETIGCSEETIKTYRKRIREKTKARSRAEMSQWIQTLNVN